MWNNFYNKGFMMVKKRSAILLLVLHFIVCTNPDTFPEKCCIMINGDKKVEFSNNTVFISKLHTISSFRIYARDRKGKKGEFILTCDTILINNFPYHLYKKIRKLIKRIQIKGGFDVSFKGSGTMIVVWDERINTTKGVGIGQLSEKEYKKQRFVAQSIVNLIETNEIFKNRNTQSFTKYWNREEYSKLYYSNLIDSTVSSCKGIEPTLLK